MSEQPLAHVDLPDDLHQAVENELAVDERLRWTAQPLARKAVRSRMPAALLVAVSIACMIVSVWLPRLSGRVEGPRVNRRVNRDSHCFLVNRDSHHFLMAARRASHHPDRTIPFPSLMLLPLLKPRLQAS